MEKLATEMAQSSSYAERTNGVALTKVLSRSPIASDTPEALTVSETTADMLARFRAIGGTPGASGPNGNGVHVIILNKANGDLRDHYVTSEQAPEDNLNFTGHCELSN